MSVSDPYMFAKSPLFFIKTFWPDIVIYKEQKQILESVRDHFITECYAGNKLGKDFIAGLTTLWFFCSRPRARVVTTSVDQQQLQAVLWGEIRRFIQTSKYPLPIQANHLHLRKVLNGQLDGLSYVIGRVAKKGEGMLGHHMDSVDDIPTTFFVADEASGVNTDAWDKADTWAHRKLAIGNPFPTVNFFFQDWKEGEIWNTAGTKLLRKQITIKGEDSPNVKQGKAAVRAGKEVTNKQTIPGVLTYEEYEQRRRLWDAVLQSIGLDAKFWEGAEALLFPPQWLALSERKARELSHGPQRKAKAIGIDPAEGGDKTTMAAVDEEGLIELVSKKTPDTSLITGEALAFMYKHGVQPENVMFDAGGGGKQHADRLRRQGYDVKTVAFGAGATANMVDFIRTLDEREDDVERRYVYKNRRSEMYGILRRLLDPFDDLIPGTSSFAIPAEYTELTRQLALIPLLYDDEGRMYMLPKGNSKLGDKLREKGFGTKTLTEIIGHSPDEADAVVIAVFKMIESGLERSRTVGGAF